MCEKEVLYCKEREANMCHCFIQQDRELRPEEIDGKITCLPHCVSALQRLTYLLQPSHKPLTCVFRAP